MKNPETEEDDRYVILDKVSVHFKPGNLVGIMGPSGCGKTTLLDLLTGRRKSDSGLIEVKLKTSLLGKVHDKVNHTLTRFTYREQSLSMEHRLAVITLNGTLPTLVMSSNWPRPTMKS